MMASISRRTLVLVAATLPLLAGCFGAAVVGAGAGVLMLTDRRPSETYVLDEGIELRAGNRIREKYGDRAHVNVTSFNRMVLLTGEVPDAAAKADLDQLVAGVPNVRAITNEAAAAGPSALSARANDGYITSKVKARFVDSNRFAANHVKVVTENSIVYLLGIVTQAEADAAVDVARTTAGVRQVVRVFEIITPEQARAIDGPPAKKTN